MNRENLNKLADYLLSLPENYTGFHMGEYCATYVDETGEGYDEEDLLQPTEASCGTVACGLGHGPAAGIKPHGIKNWWEYSNKYFIETWDLAWIWCFDSRWEYVDNTPHGCGLRIKWLLKHGLPVDHSGQRLGLKPLCYKVENNDE